jgi:hypothetical protein
MQLQSLNQVTARPITWFWPGRFAQGKLAILDGDPGLGKSLLALDLCARLSTGRPFPDDQPGPCVGNAIVLNAEDGAQDTTRPRLQALGANLERVFVPLQEDQDSAELFRLPAGIPQLDSALKRTQARLVVFDPVLAFLDASIIANSDQAVRRALWPLLRLADRYQCVMLLIRHLNKSAGGRSLYRGAGSIGFLGACRSGWLVGSDPSEPGRRVLAQVKNNLAPPQPSLAFTVETTEGCPRLCWQGTSPLSSDQLLVPGPPSDAVRPRDLARNFLADFLGDGPRTSRELWQEAQQVGLSERTLYRARKDLRVVIQRVARNHQILNYWLLPGQQIPKEERASPDIPDLEEWLAPLRQQFPPATPLDEF